MNTMLIEVTNQNALKLLHELEELHLIKVIKSSIRPAKKLSAKYAGKLPEKIADELQNHITKSREEWGERDI